MMKKMRHAPNIAPGEDGATVLKMRVSPGVKWRYIFIMSMPMGLDIDELEDMDEFEPIEPLSPGMFMEFMVSMLSSGSTGG